jgi:hypothetical protein
MELATDKRGTCLNRKDSQPLFKYAGHCHVFPFHFPCKEHQNNTIKEDKMSAATEEQLPALPADLTPEWFGEKLGQKVKSVENTRNIWGTASKLFYTITYEDESSDERPTHVCVKGVFDPEMIASQPWTVSLAQREAEFFSKVAPTVDHMLFPKGWWSGTSEKQGIAVMDDLTIEGCTFAGEDASYSFDKVMNGVEQLAGLHAKYWGQSQEDHPCKEPPFASSHPAI